MGHDNLGGVQSRPSVRDLRLATAIPAAAAAAVALALGLAGCHREEHFESVCQITRKATVEVDDNGAATQVDLELEWDPCPGQQVQIVRGGAEFAKCVQAYKPGDYVNVKVSHFWDTRGFYDWDLYEVGGCARPNSDESLDCELRRRAPC